MRLPKLTLLALVALLSPIAGESAEADPALEAKIDAIAKPYVENDVVVGMSVGVLKAGEETLVGYGSMGDGRGAPDGDTLYEIGSITKVFTGLLLADAVAEGLVQLDQPAGRLLPSVVTMPSKGGQSITLLHLATHTSGLPRLPDNLDLSNYKNPYAPYGGKQLASFLVGHRLAREPGTKSEYSNLGMGLLGKLVARTRKLSYEEALKQRILDPLGMDDTTITLGGGAESRFATGHDSSGTEVGAWDFQALAPAGAIRSSASDMLKFAGAFLDPPDGQLGEAIEVSWKVHQQPMDGNDFAMGLAWQVARDGSTRWHNGQTGGYHGMLLVSRPLNVGVVVLANSATGEVDRLAQDLVLLLAGANVEPREFDKKPEGVVEVAPDVVERYPGVYQLVPGVEFTVTEKNGKLFVRLTGQPAFEVYPRSETEWFYTVVEATLTFEVDKRGRSTAVTLFQNGVRQRAKRIK